MSTSTSEQRRREQLLAEAEAAAADDPVLVGLLADLERTLAAAEQRVAAAPDPEAA